MARVSQFTESNVDIAGARVHVRSGGSGNPLLVVHGELGLPDWIESLDMLSRRHTIVAPTLPGYGGSDRLDWIMSVRDLAAWIAWFARAQNLRPPFSVMGFSIGAWALAELATFAPMMFKKQVLVGAMGLKPETGMIWDYFLESGRRAYEQAFYDPENAPAYAKYYKGEWSAEQSEAVEDGREMTCRLAWKPYMHSLTLPDLLGGVATPTLLVWGRQDAITPLSCAEAYQRALPNATLELIDQCGHMPELERPEAFVAAAQRFLGE